MSESSPDLPGTAGQLRTLAVRLSDDLRAQLDVIAQLNQRSVTEEIRVALEAWIERSKADPAMLARADAVRADIEKVAENRRVSIEREAQARRDAIEGMFASVASPKARATKRDDASSTEQ